MSEQSLTEQEAIKELKRLQANYQIETIFTAAVDSWIAHDFTPKGLVRGARVFRVHIFAFDPKGLQRGYGGSATMHLARFFAAAFGFEIHREGGVLMSDVSDVQTILGRLFFGNGNESQLRHEALL